MVGASGGVGAALAAAFADRGALVHALSRRADGGDQRVRRVAIDIEDEASIQRAAATVSQSGKPIDLVLVATGILHGDGVAPEKTYRQISAEGMARTFAINTIGPGLIAKHFLPLLPVHAPSMMAMLSARVGSIGDNRLGGWYSYRASKAALNMIVRSLAIELARTRPLTACVALHPGTVDTKLSQPFQRGVPADRLFSPQTAARQLIDVIEQLPADASGKLFAWDGREIVP
ncbi:SDR family NAD(P)-dependent oxidoreductase [Sphingosinicella sp. BN140058]|nr:SDR family NAD(P)-dependent oxidoreductase [Sphingosinicella sp. BN140058]QAY78785.1 SDR family NAD(P)-dependent oxidoreductase [Sphingosinicella sp. BN140058]